MSESDRSLDTVHPEVKKCGHYQKSDASSDEIDARRSLRYVHFRQHPLYFRLVTHPVSERPREALLVLDI